MGKTSTGSPFIVFTVASRELYGSYHYLECRSGDAYLIDPFTTTT